MIKVIKLGKVETKEKTFECQHCGTVWIADEESYKCFFDHNDDIYWSVCPLCDRGCSNIKE